MEEFTERELRMMRALNKATQALQEVGDRVREIWDNPDNFDDGDLIALRNKCADAVKEINVLFAGKTETK